MAKRADEVMVTVVHLSAPEALAMKPPRIRLPVVGHAKLFAEISAAQSTEGHPRVTGEFRAQWGPTFDVLMMEGPITFQHAPHAIWVHIGTCAFRTELSQEQALQAFVTDAERYSRRFEAANTDQDRRQ